MMRKPSQIVHCISCDLSCQLFPDSAVRVQYCHNAAFSIWPDGNAFLKKGFIEK
ncbi:helix-turn-helix transcriptional regulator, partial [Salmonella enterica]|nr:helix-turn-helix transcriptional regulator [Salmonella enterica]EMB5390807.1 helix-turn-helix transcriptional regulator [Salmonella enterica]